MEGVRDATRDPLPCWQAHSEDAVCLVARVFDRSEDCLYLTVWAEEDIDEPRPVMVWLHGGAHTGGWGHHPIFDGTALAEAGVIVVTVNYRLGPWGFLAAPMLSEAALEKDREIMVCLTRWRRCIGSRPTLRPWWRPRERDALRAVSRQSKCLRVMSSPYAQGPSIRPSVRAPPVWVIFQWMVQGSRPGSASWRAWRYAIGRSKTAR